MNFNCAPNFPSFDFIMHEKIGAHTRFCLEGENEPPFFTLIFIFSILIAANLRGEKKLIIL